MIANRITTTIGDDTFSIRYYKNNKRVMSLFSDYKGASFYTEYDHPASITPAKLLSMMNFECDNLKLTLRTLPGTLSISWGDEYNFFESDFSVFNAHVFGILGVRDFIFDNEALEHLKVT